MNVINRLRQQTEVIIMEDSPEAARIETVTGWVSRDGRFFGSDERLARYCGATHRKCATCGEVHVINGYCNNCHNVMRHSAFHSLEKITWNGEFPLTVFDSDDYFFSLDELLDYCYENDVKPHELRLCLCKANYPRQIDSEYWCDDLSEDGELPSAMQEAIDVLNAVIEKQPPLSYSQSNVAVVIDKSYQESIDD